MRDSQRSRVYEAERAFFREYIPKHHLGNIEGCQEFIDNVLSRKYVKRHYNCRPVHVKRGGTGRSYAIGLHTIAAAWYREHWSKPVMLHELAHILAKRKYGTSMGHNWAFCAVYLDLVHNVLGKEAHDVLKQGFKENKARFRKPYQRKLTEEQREVLRERIKKARLAKAAKT